MPTLSAVVPATDTPPTLAACLEAIRAAEEPPEELIAVREAPVPGPAAARNRGAREATGEVVVFVDSDVLPHGDAFSRIRRAFGERPELDALFGSYDDSPTAAGTVSGFRNLLHHHVHQQSPGPAETFWAGLGAIRRDLLLELGGFDERFREASIEDIELGMRLRERGALVELDPGLQGTHLKTWGLRGMVETDLLRRGIPWTGLLLERGSGSLALNLGWRHRLSAVCSIGALVGLVRRRPLLTAGSLGAMLVINRSFYGLLLRKRGPLDAGAGVGLHVLHHLTGAAAVPLAAARHLLSRDPDRTRAR
ncbi:MAG: glycosyltransferase family 2 protein [Gaiellaceae bacterium]